MTRVMLYVQHLMGIGHQRRAATIARALVARGADVTYVSGGMAVPGLDVGGARLVQLPPARAADAGYAGLVDAGGRAVDDGWRARRRDRLLAVFAARRPDVVVTETFPFGRGLLRFELLPLLDAVASRRPRPRLASSVRDIIEWRDDPRRFEEMAAQCAAHYDRVLVHADPDVVRLEASFPPFARIARQVVYTGYVVDPGPPDDGGHDGAGEVVVSAGGGVAGARLLEAALAAHAMGAASDRTWRFLLGPDVPPACRDAVRAAAGPGLVVEPNRPDFPLLLRRCRLSVSRGGYNTVLEVLRAGARAVVVPWSEGGQREQQTRARALAGRGLIHLLEDADLAPAALAAAVTAAADGGRPQRRVDMGGAPRSAAEIEALGAPARGCNASMS